MRSDISFTVSPGDCHRLRGIVVDPKSLHKHVWRVRIVLLSGEGLDPWTSPYRQVAASREMCIKCIRHAAEDIEPLLVDGPSRQWFHPPIWTYLRIGHCKGVW